MLKIKWPISKIVKSTLFQRPTPNYTKVLCLGSPCQNVFEEADQEKLRDVWFRLLSSHLQSFVLCFHLQRRICPLGFGWHCIAPTTAHSPYNTNLCHSINQLINGHINQLINGHTNNCLITPVWESSRKSSWAEKFQNTSKAIKMTTGGSFWRNLVYFTLRCVPALCRFVTSVPRWWRSSDKLVEGSRHAR